MSLNLIAASALALAAFAPAGLASADAAPVEGQSFVRTAIHNSVAFQTPRVIDGSKVADIVAGNQYNVLCTVSNDNIVWAKIAFDGIDGFADARAMEGYIDGIPAC